MPIDFDGSQGPHQCMTLVTDSGTGEKFCVSCGRTVEERSAIVPKILVGEKLDALRSRTSSFTATLMPRSRQLVSDEDFGSTQDNH